MLKKEKISLTSQVIKGSFWNTLTSIVQRVGGLIITIILARVLLPEGFGTYNLVLSIALLFTLFTEGGINSAVVRYLSETNNNKKKTKLCFQYILKLKIIILLISSGLLILLVFPLSFIVFKKPVILIPLIIASFFIFIFSLGNFFNSLFFAIKKVKYITLKEFIYQFSRVLIITLAIWLSFFHLNTAYVMIILTISSLIALLFIFYKTYILSPYLFKKQELNSFLAKEDKKRILNFTFIITITSISYLLLGNIDTLMFGALVNDITQLGIYRSAFTLASSIAGLFALGQVLLPIFVQVKKIRLGEAFNKVLKYSMAFAIPATFGLAVLSSYFIVLIYGYEYIEATIPLIILSFLIIPFVQISLFSCLFLAKERLKEYTYFLIAIIMINIFLNYAFIKLFLYYLPNFIVIGVAIATLLSWFFYSIGLEIIARKKLKIQSDITLFIKPIFASLVMVMIISLLKIRFVTLNLVSGFFLVFSGILIYFLTMWLIKGINKEDFLLIREIFIKH